MATVYEVSSNDGSLQIAKDMIFGWCVRSAIAGNTFQPIVKLTRSEVDYLNSFSWPAYIPEEFKEALKSVSDHRMTGRDVKSERTSLPEESKAQPTEPDQEETPSGILKSRIRILAEICSKLDLVNGRFVANLKYCRVWREKNRWVVRYTRQTDFFETPFPTVEAAAEFIAKRWW